MTIQKLFIFILLALFAQNSFGQQYQWKKSDEQLAIQFYQNGEYEKARPLFEELIKDGNDQVDEYYFDCLIKLADYKEAEKFLKKRIKKSSNKH
ncbi:MAG: tetratricopeptide repeat protein, partial [Bacteroidetes bacterium]|nr:tetratricopeptide repeat protein [Bacteroidota bacterium]